MNMPLAFGLPQGSEWFIVFLAIVLLFGAKKLPELARALGKSLGEFRKAKDELNREIHRAANEEEAVTPPASANSGSPTPADKEKA